MHLSEEERADIASGKTVIEPTGTRETATIVARASPNEKEFAEIIASGKVAIGK